MSEQTDNDITIEFYYKSCQYKSPITGAVISFNIKKVWYSMIYSKEYPHWKKEIHVVSENGITYNKDDLFNFEIKTS